jgi:hypothetical protein
MAGRRITLQDVERYIGGKRGLRKDLQSDYQDHRFIREADLEVCTYYHLRECLQADKRWKIFARAYRKGLGRFPDFTVLEGLKCRIVIELKWRKENLEKKDRKVLNKFLGRPHRRKAYFITTVMNKSDYEKLGSKKRQLEKYRLKELPVALGLDDNRLDDWKRERKTIKAALSR